MSQENSAESLAAQRVAATVGFIQETRIGEHLFMIKWSQPHPHGFSKIGHAIPFKKKVFNKIL